MPLREWLNRPRHNSARLLLWAALGAIALTAAWRFAENGRYQTQVLLQGRLIVITDTRSGDAQLCVTLDHRSRCRPVGKDTLQAEIAAADR